MCAYPRYRPRYLIYDMKIPHPIRSRYPIFRTLVEMDVQEHNITRIQNGCVCKNLEEVSIEDKVGSINSGLNMFSGDKYLSHLGKVGTKLKRSKD